MTICAWIPRRLRRRSFFLSRRERAKLGYKLVIILLFSLMFILAILHLVVLPNASGGYNDECYLSDEKRATLRLMVQNISETFQKFDVKYWLDYGTLLGAYRIGDVLPWDHDADISFIFGTDSKQVYDELAARGINANGLIATYANLSVDFVRWTPATNSTVHRENPSEVLLEKFYPESVLINEEIIKGYFRKLETFPLSWALPAKRIDFHGVSVSIPNLPERLLTHRYPYTFGRFNFQFPYKWKCWVPCWLRKTTGC